MLAHDGRALISERRPHWASSLSVKLVFLLAVSMTVVFGFLGFLIVRLHRQHLEQSTLVSAERVSDVIRRSTTYYMLRNDRYGMYHAIATMADEPGIVRVRIFDQEGRISYSSDPSEVSHIVDKSAEACYGCHAQSQPLVRLNRPDRFRIYRDGQGQRILGIVTPIDNQPSCANADCHAHPARQQILGVLDTNLSLAKADAQLAQGSRRMLAYTFVSLLVISLLSWVCVWRLVGQPLKHLKNGTKELANGNLGYQLRVNSSDEAGELAISFNRMSLQLHAANDEIVSWAKTLEDRVEQKTRELKRAHEHVLHVEKMATIGKMAAVVAHEINNPLSGILTYAKLVRKWIERGDAATSKKTDAEQSLDLIALESRRCGDLVKNLLTFARNAPMNVQTTDLNAVVDRSIRLVTHQLEMRGVEVHRNLPQNLPQVQCDPAQIEQVLLALVMNANDAMPRGGNLWIGTRLCDDATALAIEVRDDGAGIPADVIPHLREPFLTTKENGKSLGLGLAVSHNIVEGHGGRMEVQSKLGKGTTFTVTLPLEVDGTAVPGAMRETGTLKSR